MNPAGPNGVLGYSTTGTGSFLTGGSPTLTGTWTTTTPSGASWVNATSPAGSGTSTATWTITGLTPGATYQLSTAWQGLSTRATDAAFTVTGGGLPIDYQRIVQNSGLAVVSPLLSVEPIPTNSGTQDSLNALATAAAWPNTDAVQFAYNWPNTTDTTSTLNLSPLIVPSALGVLQVPLTVTPQDKGPKGKRRHRLDRRGVFSRTWVISS